MHAFHGTASLPPIEDREQSSDRTRYGAALAGLIDMADTISSAARLEKVAKQRALRILKNPMDELSGRSAGRGNENPSIARPWNNLQDRI
jgi:hypothetical protein